jgi:hypothetical protein
MTWRSKYQPQNVGCIIWECQTSKFVVAGVLNLDE